MTWEELKSEVLDNSGKQKDWVKLNDEANRIRESLTGQEFRALMFQEGGWSILEMIGMRASVEHGTGKQGDSGS